jgi:hypothetical protein
VKWLPARKLVESSAVGSQLVPLGSSSCKVPASDDRSHWIGKPKTLHCWKPLPSSAMKAVTENTSLCVTVICKLCHELCVKVSNKSHYQSNPRL